MISFESDYTIGAHPLILKRLCETNEETLVSYGGDKYTESAKEKIRSACGCDNAGVYLLSGGTQTNLVAISSLLRDYEGVLCADTGHITCHEAGAIEYTGHKVIALKGHEGRLLPETLEEYLNAFYADETCEHMVQPGMVYISQPTEYGTLYSLNQLSALSEICRKYSLPLYMDGARLGYGLMSRQNDVTLKDIAKLCDAFYIGGTKVGALCGEALVFPWVTPKHFFTQIKQHGAHLAKGRVTGVQFDTLFTDDLYFKISENAINTAEMLKALLKEKGYRFFLESPTNQQFVILENSDIERLNEKVSFGFWEKYDDTHTVVRFATSWATKPEDIDELGRIL